MSKSQIRVNCQRNNLVRAISYYGYVIEVSCTFILIYWYVNMEFRNSGNQIKNGWKVQSKARNTIIVIHMSPPCSSPAMIQDSKLRIALAALFDPGNLLVGINEGKKWLFLECNYKMLLHSKNDHFFIQHIWFCRIFLYRTVSLSFSLYWN